jgi:glutamine---fructose-6-phosphate transaminase (isomerizing)
VYCSRIVCGIFGVVCKSDPRVDPDLARALSLALLRHSETRGRQAAGVAVHDGEEIHVYKQSVPVREFLRSPKLAALLARAQSGLVAGRTLAIVGHARLATNGTQVDLANNQPVVTRGAIALHNGIIVNDRALAERHGIVPESELDSEVLAALLRERLNKSGDLVAATRATFAELQGSASLAMLFDDLDAMLLATNTGSLFQLSACAGHVSVFASERFILQRLLQDRGLARRLGAASVEQLEAGSAVAVRLGDLGRRTFSLAPAHAEAALADTPGSQRATIVDHSSRVDRLRRCTRCVLPETFPFVRFDADGVCAYCRTWKPIEVKGHEALLREVEPYRSRDGSPDVIVAFSGGRDSSYGLHYVKTVLGMNPIAFTYDWGLVTDLARRNCARVCGKLGVEHIIRSADISAKRRYVRKNIEAWLKKPELGMVSLFMAGDKEFYAHARKLRKETGVELVIFCSGNLIEEARYKTGLMGVPQDDDAMVLPNMSLRNKLGMLWYFAKNYAKNPAYLNESLLDTANAFYQTFVVKDDFLYLYHYLPWREDEIVGTIRREYDWEIATDTQTTWRIGDGTAAFYNYIYGTIAGFTEDESMLSNMVREGHLTRAEALERAREYSKPRWDSLREYAQLIGFSFEEAIQAINAVPKRY